MRLIFCEYTWKQTMNLPSGAGNVFCSYSRWGVPLFPIRERKSLKDSQKSSAPTSLEIPSVSLREGKWGRGEISTSLRQMTNSNLQRASFSPTFASSQTKVSENAAPLPCALTAMRTEVSAQAKSLVTGVALTVNKPQSRICSGQLIKNSPLDSQRIHVHSQ